MIQAMIRPLLAMTSLQSPPKTALQPQSTTNLPADQALTKGLNRWWTTLQCEVSDLWQNVSDRNTGKIYRSALHKTWELLRQVATILLLLLITIVVLILGAWLLGFQAGRKLREWLEAENPTPGTIVAKFFTLLLWPLQVFTRWLDRTLHRVFGWDLKLTDLLPPIDPALLPKGLTDSSTNSDS